MPGLMVVERDYGALADMMSSLGPNVENLGTVVKGVTLEAAGIGGAASSSQRDHPGWRC